MNFSKAWAQYMALRAEYELMPDTPAADEWFGRELVKVDKLLNTAVVNSDECVFARLERMKLEEEACAGDADSIAEYLRGRLAISKPPMRRKPTVRGIHARPVRSRAAKTVHQGKR